MLTADITAKDLTITADVQSKTYGDSDPELTYQIMFGTLEDGDTITGDLTRIVGENVNSYAIQQGTLTAGANYEITYMGANLTITAKELTVTNATANKVYDGTTVATITGATLNGVVGNDDVSLENDTTGIFAQADVGTGIGVSTVMTPMTISGTDSGNYTLIQPILTADITAKALTITAAVQSKTYGDSDPAFTVSYDGFIEGENETALGGSLSFTRAPGEEPGSYAITPLGLTADNYAITFIDGTLTILSTNADLSDLTLSSGTLSPTFDSGTTSYTASVSHSVSSITVTPTIDDANATLAVDGMVLTSGQPSNAISLNVGSNTINVVVTAEDGATTKTYTITVTRARASTGGGGGGTPVPPPVPTVDSDGNITTTPKLDKNTGVAATEIDAATMNEAFEKATENSDGKKTVEIAISAVEGANAYETTLPASVLSSSDADTQLKIKTDIAEVTLLGKMLVEEAAALANDVSLTIAQADVSAIEDEETRNRIGDRPVIQLTLQVDGEHFAWSNENAPVTVSIPYTPTKEELANPEHITIWYIDGEGNVVEVPSGRYDPVTGTVIFRTTHFSDYAVVYVTKTFDDLGSVAWAKEQIEVLASKGILRGISETEYAPKENITRVDFLYFLVRTLGVEAEFTENFDDISEDAYYYKEIGIAKKLGITNGTGNNKFNPDASITRQDMMTLTERALRMLNKLTEQGTASDLEKFADKELIASYAKESVAAVVKEGLIIGSGDNINPLGNTTRAEAAVFLYRIYNKY